LKGNAFRKKKKELMQMKPLPGLDIDQYNVLVLGAVGAGKSSFINTLSVLVTGKIEPIAPSRQFASSVTNKVFITLNVLYLCNV
jgi:predicted GTPase